MNRLDRFRFGNLHKRRFFFVVALIILMVFVSVMFLLFIGFFGSRAELPRIRASAELTSDRTEGVGINLLEIPDTNIIDDPFFSKQDEFMSASVTDAVGNYIFFDPSLAGTLQSHSAGDSVSILSIDGSGNMGLRYTGTIVGFAETMFAVPVIVEDPSALWTNDPVIKTVECSGELYLLTSRGKIISDAAINPRDESAGMTYTDMCTEGINIYALTDNGQVYVSADSGLFTFYGSCEVYGGTTARYISVINGSVYVFLTDGSIVNVQSGGSTVIGQMELSKVVTGDGFMVACSEDAVYVSRNGLFMSRLEEADDLIREGDRIIDLVTEDTTAYALTSYGTLIRIDMSDYEPLTDSVDISSVEPVEICPSGNHCVIAVTTDHQSYYVSMAEGSPESLNLTGISVDDVMMFGDQRYIIRSGNTLYESSLRSAVEVDVPIADDLVLEGDICIIKSASIDTDAWDLYGDTELLSSADGVSVIGTGDGMHAISRVLEAPSNELFEQNLFYRIEITMSSDTEDVPVNVWLQGDTFGSHGNLVTDVTDQMKSFSYVFAVTESMLSDESLRFNVSYEGSAVLNISNIYVGLDRYDINSVPPEFNEFITGSAPVALRFSSTVPGSNGFCEETYYGVCAESLEREMIMCKDSGAAPWIVLGSALTQDDVNELMGYICGSVSNPMGKIRIDNGTALPWNRQFDTIYIEIGDSDGIFPTDYQRGSYVNYVISLFEKSEFYIGIKDKIVFIDGMNYEGGAMLSDADRHASTMFINECTDENGNMLPFLDSVDRSIEEAISSAPRAASRGTDGGEFVSSLRISAAYGGDRYLFAETVAALLRTESEYSDIIMIDSDMEVCRIIGLLRALMGGEVLYCEVLDPLDTSSDYTAERFNSCCETMLVDSPTGIYLIVANYSDSLQQFTYISDSYDTSEGYYRRYSFTGELLIERDLNHFGQRQLLQPGEFMVIEISK